MCGDGRAIIKTMTRLLHAPNILRDAGASADHRQRSAIVIDVVVVVVVASVHCGGAGGKILNTNRRVRQQRKG
jgi:hypothetical protein